MSFMKSVFPKSAFPKSFRPQAARLSIAAVVALTPLALTSAPAAAAPLPTVVLVHGAFADSTGWNEVADNLTAQGYPVETFDNPLRGPAYDSTLLEQKLAGIEGPIVLVGHSYGGVVISNADNPNVKANVYIAAFAPDRGEFVQGILNPLQFPGSKLLPPALQLKIVDDAQAIGGLTAKARIRNAALDLYAERGEDRVSMRAVAAAAGVAVGLVQHHFKTKDGLRVAVEQLVVDYYALAIASVPDEGAPAQVAAARDEAVRHMLATHPTVVNYIRRAVLDPQGKSELLERLTDLSRREISKLRYSGKTSTRRSESSQVIGLMVRQLGQLLMQPMIDDMCDFLDRTGVPHSDKLTLSVTVI